MGVLLYRVDDRLVHGQVTVGWARALQPDAFIIVDDEVASSAWEARLFQSAAPDPIEVSVWSSAEAGEELPRVQAGGGKAILLTRDLQTMSSLVRGGLVVPSVNLGGLHFSSGKTQILPYISLGPEDVEILADFRERGIELDVRDVPTTDRKDLFGLLKRQGLLDA